jgi:hypothetical protein
MAKPGGWNKTGLQFNDTDNDLRFFLLNSQGAEELPLEAMTSDETSISTKLNEARIQLLESRDLPTAYKRVGIRATQEFVERLCHTWNIPAEFLLNVRKPGALPWFLHQVEEDRGNAVKFPKLKALNLCLRWGPGHDAFVVMFGRYDVESSTLRAFLSSRTVAGDISVLDLFKTNAHELLQHPLQLFGMLMGLCESYVDADAQEQNKKNIEVGALLGVQDLEWVKGWHLEPCSSVNKSQTIYAAYDSTNWLNKSCEELISIGKQYLILVKYLETRYHFTIPRDEVQNVVHRAELDAHMLRYLERMLRSQFDSYNNYLAREESKISARISATSANIAKASYKDSQSMKTVSYLTMVFFPITFVSAIFSTTIFDFQQWDAASVDTGVVSPGWWVFVLCCGLVMVLTLGAWRFWQNEVEKRKNLEPSPDIDLEKGSGEHSVSQASKIIDTCPPDRRDCA